MLDAVVGLSLACYLIVGISMVVGFADDLPGPTEEAKWALALVVFIFAPLAVAATVGAMLYRASATVGVGFHDLWVELRPSKPKLPRARAKEKRP